MNNTKSHAWYAERYQQKYGWQLLPLQTNSKLPTGNDWGNKPTSAEHWQRNPTQGIGLALGPSQMCSLDIDCAESFALILAEFGIDQATIDQLPTIRGKGRRIMMRVPAGVTLPYCKLNWPSKNDPTREKHKAALRIASELSAKDPARAERVRKVAKRWAMYTVIELRTAGDGHQRFDVLPPSVHPTTKQPYAWEVQPSKTLGEWPEPPSWLLAIWRAWDSFKPQLQACCPWLPPEPVKKQPIQQPAQQRQHDSDQVNVFEAFNDAHDLEVCLERYGYSRKGRGRYLSPHSGTGLPGVILFDDKKRCFIHHASDPLCSDESGKPVNPFDLFCYYEHCGDIAKAAKAAATMLGIERQPRQRAANVVQLHTDTQPPQQEPQAEQPPEPAQRVAPMPFLSLGYQGDHFYYMPRSTEQVQRIKRSMHTSPAELMGLAPLEWWEMNFPKEKGGADWHSAASALMRSCEARGIYDAERERGRGAWFDDGRSVLHLGTALMVDGVRTAITDHQTRYIYTKQAAYDVAFDGVCATDEQCAEVIQLFSELAWVRPVHAALLVGWSVLAPICGSLSWRPHIWLTAQRGAGKTWVQTNMIEPLLGRSALMVQGGTTEAGIRQRLKSDSRPIVFDESESEDLKAQSRIKMVLELARQSSSDSTAEVVKGTANGDGMAFRMRSMFMLGSINVNLQQAADQSRFSVIELGKPSKTSAQFSDFERRTGNALTPAICAAIRARAYRLIPTIRANAKELARAVTDRLGSQRIGDQYGALLAGYYAMLSAELLTPDQADALLMTIDLSDASSAQSASDEESCLSRILESQVRFDINGRTIQRTIGELVEAARGIGGATNDIMQKEANGSLKRFGLMIEGGYLIIANQHGELEKVLTGTSYAVDWNRLLKRLPGAHAAESKRRFAGVLSRALLLPLTLLD